MAARWANALKAVPARSVPSAGLRTRPVTIRFNEASAGPTNPADLSGRIPHYQRVIGDIMCNHSTSAHACPSADGDPAEDHGPRSNRGAVAEDDALRIPIRDTLQTTLRIGRARIAVICEYRCRANKCEITDDRWFINKRMVLNLHVRSKSDPGEGYHPCIS